MQLDIESLRTYLMVLDTGGMTKAADRLGVSQSAVSWKIKRLETKVGQPLLIRDGHSLRPSRAGRGLLENARQIVDLHDRSVAELASSDISGVVRIGSNGELSIAELAKLLGKFRLRYPSIHVEFVIDYTDSLNVQLRTGQLDIAIVQADDDELESQDALLWTQQLYWATAIDQPYETGLVPLIDFGSYCFYNHFTYPLLDAAGVEHRVSFSGRTSADVVAAAAAGIGVGVLARTWMGGDVVDWERGQSLGELPKVHQVVRTAKSDHSEAVNALRDTICDELLAPSADG